jgi:protein-S-isoprenylcysteine O-methyltransferase
MARKSVSSSAIGNGHAARPEPEASTNHQQPSLIPGTNREDKLGEFDWESPMYERRLPLPIDSSLMPNGRRSLSSISLQAFGLGFTLALCILTTTWLALSSNPLWRLPAFFACLSLFHFLEFWTTAHYNMPAARASSFLLFSNGAAYNVAHSLATVEIITSYFFPDYQSLFVNPCTIASGFLLVILGQAVRTLAMAQAGTNFNHLPAKTKVEGHTLVTTGIYSYLRHPSYFGFFWWAFGTQVLVGNKVCTWGYLVALWKFFSDRIKAEELTLVDFFGAEYVRYRKETGVGIPFVY